MDTTEMQATTSNMDLFQTLPTVDGHGDGDNEYEDEVEEYDEVALALSRFK